LDEWLARSLLEIPLEAARDVAGQSSAGYCLVKDQSLQQIRLVPHQACLDFEVSKMSKLEPDGIGLHPLLFQV